MCVLLEDVHWFGKECQTFCMQLYVCSYLLFSTWSTVQGVWPHFSELIKGTLANVLPGWGSALLSVTRQWHRDGECSSVWAFNGAMGSDMYSPHAQAPLCRSLTIIAPVKCWHFRSGGGWRERHPSWLSLLMLKTKCARVRRPVVLPFFPLPASLSFPHPLSPVGSGHAASCPLQLVLKWWRSCG